MILTDYIHQSQLLHTGIDHLHRRIKPLHILLLHRVNPLVLPFAPKLHHQLPALLPIGLIQRASLDHYPSMIAAWLRCKVRSAVPAEHAGNVQALIRLVDEEFGLALCPVQARFGDNDVGGESGARVSLTVNAVAQNDLS